MQKIWIKLHLGNTELIIYFPHYISLKYLISRSRRDCGYVDKCIKITKRELLAPIYGGIYEFHPVSAVTGQLISPQSWVEKLL